MTEPTTMAQAAWQPVTSRLGDWMRDVRRFGHLSTSRGRRDNDTGLFKGQSIWGTTRKGQAVAVFFEWAEVTRGVVALADPMRILSNVKLVTDEGQPFEDSRSLLEWNNAVYGLDWQSSACDQLRLWRSPQSEPKGWFRDARLPTFRPMRRNQVVVASAPGLVVA